MLWEENFSYISMKDINKGLCMLDIHSINICRYYSEDQKEENAKYAEKVGIYSELWSEYCESIRYSAAEKIKNICDYLSEKFHIYQYGNENYSYDSDEWDLFFWCNNLNQLTNGKESGRDYSYVTLTFNRRMCPYDKFRLLDTIKEYLIGYEESGVKLIVQYSTKVNEDFCNEKADEIVAKSNGKLIDTAYGRGRLTKVNNEYRFQKARVRKYYYRLSALDVCKSVVV